jgi:hypothetical protein
LYLLLANKLWHNAHIVIPIPVPIPIYIDTIRGRSVIPE